MEQEHCLVWNLLQKKYHLVLQVWFPLKEVQQLVFKALQQIMNLKPRYLGLLLSLAFIPTIKIIPCFAQVTIQV